MHDNAHLLAQKIGLRLTAGINHEKKKRTCFFKVDGFLGLERASEDNSEHALRRAYRLIVKGSHPDKGGSDEAARCVQLGLM